MLFSNTLNFFRRILETWPLHLILLPVYFIGHAYIQFSGLLDIHETAISFLKVTVGIVLFFLLLNLILKKTSKAAVFSTVCASFFLFFGDIKNIFSQLPVLHHIGHYKILLPLLFVFLLFVFLKIRRSKQLIRSTLFLNVLFLIYFSIDAVKLFYPGQKGIGMTKTNLSPVDKDNTGRLPNIYYILLDCYPSKGYQEEVLGIKNNYFDSSLALKDFYLIKHSRSNYNITAYSMAGTFGLNYFSNIDSNFRMSPLFYNKAMRIINNSPVLTLLSESGYKLYNLSIFDFQNHPALKKELFISYSTTQMIFFNTLWSSFRRELGWKFFPGLVKKLESINKMNIRNFLNSQKEYNSRLLDSLSIFPVDKNGKSPFFVYAHLLMPHFPYFYDSSGKPYSDDAIYTDSLITDKSKFANYIVYTKNIIDELITKLLKKSAGKDIIIIQSDHTVANMNQSKKEDVFRNFSAFYFPDKDYSLLYDGMSNVNTFRVVLNKYFGQKLPLLPDKTYYIR